MTPKFTARNDLLAIHLHGDRDPLAGGSDCLRELMAMFEAHGFAPDTLAGSGGRPYSVDAAIAAIARGKAGGASITVERRAAPECAMSMLFLATPRPMRFKLELTAPLARFADAEQAAQVVALMRALAPLVDPRYGLAHSQADYYLGRDPLVATMHAQYTVAEPYWLGIYGPAMVESIGRDRIASTPATRIEWLDGGAVMIQLGDTPATYAAPAARRAQAAAIAHLCGGDGAAELARLEERSRKLAPVAPAWNADVADLFEAIADHVAFRDRPQEVARLNALPVVEPAEWRPAAEQSPANVAKPAQAIARYATYAEQLVALLHARVTANNDPATLPATDEEIWIQDFPARAGRRDIEQDLVPAVGGYIGQMLVDRLGGTWIPRRALDETQVLVGDRVWLPFERARRYLKSRDSVLVYSLTQYFRAARRG